MAKMANSRPPPLCHCRSGFRSALICKKPASTRRHAGRTIPAATSVFRHDQPLDLSGSFDLARFSVCDGSAKKQPESWSRKPMRMGFRDFGDCELQPHPERSEE